jgi:hypothetical protein
MSNVTAKLLKTVLEEEAEIRRPTEGPELVAWYYGFLWGMFAGLGFAAFYAWC